MSSKADAPTDGSNAGISDFLKKFDPTLSPADYIKRFFFIKFLVFIFLQ
jgi:hypothetical protein